MTVTMRQATQIDRDKLLSWRNDPETLAASRSTAPISQEEHDRWMRMSVLQGYPEHYVLIAEGDEGSVGVVRFDSSKDDLMAYDVSLIVAPKHRGQGLAHDVLREACSYMGGFTLSADIRRDNVGSRKVFERVGFEEIARDNGFLKFRKEPLP